MTERYITTSVRFPPDDWLDFLINYLQTGGYFLPQNTLTKAIKYAAEHNHDTIITVVE